MRLKGYFFILFYSLHTQANEQVEIERPRADLFQSKLNNMMQDTASWLDDIEGTTNGGASAKGYLQLGWLPRTADLSEVDAKLKIAFNLPNVNDKLALIIDNYNEDELLLDYESDPFKESKESVNLAAQYIKEFNNNYNIKTRIGVSRKQLYVRTEANLNWRYEKLKFEFLPRIDYFYKDGWGPGLKGALAYYLEGSTISFSASWQKLESEARSRRKVGLFHVFKPDKDQLLVSGAQYNKSNNKENISNETYYFSLRYRNLIYKSWLYLEVEPFVEFNQFQDFRREYGIALSLITYYGT
ncbi:hypothetical protein [Colwellia sp. RSH04]|uniref:hypothetical protein n=1 Tax=Colwellia sp. RSH04 TaxID=2305464 RepID=UPI0015F90243|nr:hypothetical protein [Colwellia sp. RSH04]